jgi:hypothetical protein
MRKIRQQLVFAREKEKSAIPLFIATFGRTIGHEK